MSNDGPRAAQTRADAINEGANSSGEYDVVGMYEVLLMQGGAG
jgi:hypothetical protein